MVCLWKAWKEKKKGPIPACCWKQFPEADGNYTVFKDPSITELDLSFFEYIVSFKQTKGSFKSHQIK